MWCRLSTSLMLALLAAQTLPATCPCMVHYGVCDETRQSDAVFVGTVESVAPPFLDPYTRSKAMASMPAAETAKLQADKSPEALAKLKKIYLDMFAGMPDYARSLIADAPSQQALQAAFEAAQSEGRVAKFRVGTMYKHGDDDGDDDKPKTLEIWTGSGDCGIDFQAGETYLVYALEDEASGKLETSVCMRTRRLSDERGDLGFLSFLQKSEKESTRLEGFVSSSYSDQNLPRYEDAVTEPISGALIELDGGAGVHYSRSDAEGRYAFDGLKAGEYRLSLLNPGFPAAPRSVIQSRLFQIEGNSCARQVFIQAAPRP